jgi:hypothetical protein
MSDANVTGATATGVTIQDMGERIAAWTEALGFESVSDGPDSCIIHSRGGETRWFVFRGPGEIIVTSSQRSKLEAWFAFSSADLVDVERYLVGVIGPALRAELMPQAPRIKPRVRLDELAPPFAYVPARSNSRQAELMDGGYYRARFASLKSPLQAVRFSQYANAPVDELKAAFLDPDGGTIFAVDPYETSA